MRKICKRCGEEFETGEKIRRVYCEPCLTQGRRERRKAREKVSSRKICRRCGEEFEAGAHIRRVYCDVCREETRRARQDLRSMILNGDKDFRRAARELAAAYARREKLLNTRLMSREEIAELDAACLEARRGLSAARRAAWERAGKPFQAHLDRILKKKEPRILKKKEPRP